jgi:hypothetical protein
MSSLVEGLASEPTKADPEISQMGIGPFHIDTQYTDYRKLASPNPACTLQSFQTAHQSNPTFQSFPEKLTKFIKWFLPQCQVRVQRNFRLDPSAQVCVEKDILCMCNAADARLQITEYQYL